MGANIGTSVTNTIVAMGQVTNKEEFRRAFAGATVLDVFNWLAVFILLPIEVLTGYLYYLTLEIVNSINVDADVDEPQFLQVITDPVVSAIISVSHHRSGRVSHHQRKSSPIPVVSVVIIVIHHPVVSVIITVSRHHVLFLFIMR